MRALQLTEWKHEPELRDVPEPDPGPGQVLVRVGGAGACHSDLHLTQDFDTGMVPFEPPFTLGHENAGWVESLGPGVTGLDVGQPVAVYGPTGCGTCPRCVRGLENYCERPPASMAMGLGSDGGMAPHLLVPDARHLVPLVDLDPADAAPLTDAGLTPYHAIARSLDRLVPGSTAVVVGVGGLGHLAVQLLTALSAAAVVAVDSRHSARDLALAAGARAVAAPGEDAADAIAEASRGRGADLVLDFVGNDQTMAQAVTWSRTMGHVTVVGLAGGTYPFSFFTVPYECSLAITYWGSIGELVEVIALAESGAIRAQVERVPLDDAAHAYARLARGEIDGRVVVVPDL
jgi:propanol-preferring alcohol dehydrogenase